ncbi:outer envelope pore protein 37, chloroplastic [Euphorbia lathyris]|uniref:outer envelope pore protein 37, chloroplastic n=1 Tax=Euphorbia lathyris TaxID=212925 RepID=UPI003313A909
MADSSSTPPPPIFLPPQTNHMAPPPITHADPPLPLRPSSSHSPSLPPPPIPPPPPSVPIFFKRPAVRVTSEFDSDSSLFLHKVSCKLFDSLAKLKLSFQNNNKGELSDPHLTFTSKLLSIHYDVEDQNALVKSSFDVGPTLHFKAAHDVKAQQGEVAVVAKISDPGFALEVSSPVPSFGLPRATLKFPVGEVSLEERQDEEVRRTLAVSGVVKGQILNGLCTAQFTDEALKLRYAFKDEALSFIPSISLPSNAVSFAFKRRFTPNNKLSYWYDIDSNNWSAVYKQTYGKDYKFKAGYDSDVRLGWASLWVGDEGGKARTAPMKMKVQFMLQVPQDDIRSSALMFRVKKRWDIL